MMMLASLSIIYFIYHEGACLLFVLDPEFASVLVATASRLLWSVTSTSMVNKFMVYTLELSSRSWSLGNGEPATGPPYNRYN